MYFDGMATYTSRQVAEMLGKSVQAISRYAQAHKGIGKKVGRDWIFSEADLRKLRAVERGGKRKRKAKPVKPEGEQAP